MTAPDLLAFVLATLAVHSCVCTERDPSPNLPPRPPCNVTLTTLLELQAAVNGNDTLPQNADTDYVLCVNLQPDSVEYIGYSLLFIESVSLVITGSAAGNNSALRRAPVVMCESNSNSSDLSLSDYPLTVTNSSLVVIEGVHFIGCMRTLQLNQVTRVEILSSQFRNFNPGGAIDIFKCPQVIVIGCTFSNNTNLGLGNRRYSGNAGAIAIGYDETTDQSYHPNIKIFDSTISYNRADGASDFERDASLLLKQKIFKQRGGGIAFYFGTANNSADVEIVRCSFVGNFAKSSGGGVYVNLIGANNSHTIDIRECNFTNNRAFIGGGIDLFYNPVTVEGLTSAEILAHSVSILNSVFTGNYGDYGGAISNIQLGYLNTLNVTNCTFLANEGPLGAALYLQFLFTTFSFVPEKKIVIKDCIIVNNAATHGVVFSTRNTVRIQGDTLFRENTGPSIQALSSLIRLGGSIVFDRNRHHPNGFSGVIYLSAFGQILLEEKVDIVFRNNSGREGASIVVVGQSLSEDLDEQLYNPQCFLQYEVPTVPPPEWKANLTFEDNEAFVGPVVYMTDISACIWNSTSSPFFSDLQDIEKVWRFMSMKDNFILREQGTEAINEPDYYIQTTVEYINVSLQDNQITGSPGEEIVAEVDALDELMHNTSAFLLIRVGDPSVTFVPSVVQTVAGNGQIDFIYLSDKLSGNTTVQLVPSFVSSDTDALEDSTTVSLVHEPCLPGYFRMNKKCVCEENDMIVLCGPKNRGLLLSDGLWGNFSSQDRKLVTHICPPGYCDCTQNFTTGSDDVGCLLNYRDRSSICDKTRTDMLCGRCRGNQGVGLLTNNCRQFNSTLPQFWAFLIYLVVLIPLLVTIIKLGVHLPTILRGLIVYIQLSPIAVEFLPLSFKLEVDTMSIIGSALGLYMPYDFSLHRGMTSLESYGLRYLGHLVALIVVPFAVRFRHPHFKYWHGVWTIIQLMYIMPIHVSVSLLICPSLIGSRVWFFDGSVQCYHGWHILLAIVSLISLLAVVLLVFVVAAALKFNLLRRKIHHSFGKLEPLSLALRRGLKKEYWWWPLLDLICKYLLVLTVVYQVGQKVLALVNSLIFFFLQFFIHPYTNAFANYLESFVLFVLVVLLALGNTPVVIETVTVTLWPLFYLPVFVGAVVVTVYVGYRICWKFIRRQWKSRKSKTKSNPNRKGNKKDNKEKEEVQATQTEVFMHGDNDDIIDAEFTLWDESTDM